MSGTGENTQDAYIIQGVGDEVLFVVSVLFSLASASLVALCLSGHRKRRTLTVHPSARVHVETVRQNEDIAQRSRRENLGAENCPICLTAVDNPLETNCGHVFCALCFLTLWQTYTAWPQAATCPICRRRVTLLLVGFEPAPEHYSVLRDIRDYNRRMSGAPRPWMDHIRDMPALLRHLFREFFSVRGIFLVWRIRIVILLILALLYLLSPLDFIPERVFGILGLLDDILIILSVFFVMSVIYRGAVLEQRQ